MNHLKNKYSDIPNIGYSPALDGLRAIAVILVLLTHANFQFGDNGILGVDIFFALSGFLITTLLMEEYRKYGKINFCAFYVRRTFRLFPALYLLLIFIIIYLIAFPLENEKYYSILTEVWSSALYVSNISWIWGWGRDGILLGHTWSLAIEEQYYLIWPFIFLMIVKFKKNRIVLWFFFILILLLFIINLIVNVNPIFSSLWAVSLFIGSWFAFIRFEFYKIKINQYILMFLLLFMLFVGIYPIQWYTRLYKMGCRGFIGILTGILILGILNLKNCLLVNILSNKILVFIGKISYSLYLWHVPIFKLFKWYSNWPPHLTFLMKFFTTFFISWISFYLLEKRFTLLGRKISNKFLTT